MTRGAMCPLKRRPALGRSPAWSYVSRRYQTAATIHAAHQTPSQRAFMFLSQKVTVRFRRATKWCTISIYIKWKSTWKWYSAHKMRESIIRKYVFIKGHGAEERGGLCGQKHLCDHQKRDVCSKASSRKRSAAGTLCLHVCSRSLILCVTTR